MAKLQVVGHRGAAGLAPENTLLSFKKALEHGVDMIEFDIQVTKDGVPVVHHNSAIKIGKRKSIIKSHTYSQLIKLRPALPTLQEAIDAIKHDAVKMIELKPGIKLAPVIENLQESLNTGCKPSEFIIASRDFRLLKQLRLALPSMPLMVIERYFGTRASHRARKLDTNYLCLSKRVLWFGFIRATSHDFRLFTYTLNDPGKAAKWHHYGLYGVITDYPDRF